MRTVLRLPVILSATVLFAGSSPRGVSATVARPDSLELSCVAFPAQTTEQDLGARFGPGNVVTAPVSGLDDGPSEGTVLFPDRREARLEIVWQDPQSRRSPAWIAVRDLASRWQTPNGIALGVNLRQLERANGRPFRLAGFQTEAQGRVTSWANGRLQSAASGGCTIDVYLQPRWDGTEKFALIRQVRAGREYSSAHPALQILNPRVVRVGLSFVRNTAR